jgi:hypothetical protein
MRIERGSFIISKLFMYFLGMSTICPEPYVQMKLRFVLKFSQTVMCNRITDFFNPMLAKGILVILLL